MVKLQARQLTLAQAEEIYDKYLKADFPPEEVKPFSAIRRMWEQKNYHTYGFYEQEAAGDLLCAYAFLMADNEKRMLLLDYFAVCSQLRGSGYGSLALALLRKECAGWNGILVEVEDDGLPGLEEETAHCILCKGGLSDDNSQKLAVGCGLPDHDAAGYGLSCR